MGTLLVELNGQRARVVPWMRRVVDVRSSTPRAAGRRLGGLEENTARPLGVAVEGQHPLLQLVEGLGQAEQAPDEWDARFELGVATLIKALHASAPPPRHSQVAVDLLDWAEGLQRDGQSRLESLGRQRLRVA